MMVRSAVLLGAIAFALSQPAAAEPQAGDVNPFAHASRSAIVFFVPLDAHSRELLDRIVPTLAKWLPPYQQLAIAANRKAWINPARGGERNSTTIESDLLSEFRQAQGGRTVLVMTVTSEALYSPALPQYAFVFGAWIQPHHLQYSAALGTRPMRVFQPARERSRLTRMMLRYIGEIVCIPYLRRNTNPRSVMYDPLISTADLDRMVATLPAHCRRR